MGFGRGTPILSIARVGPDRILGFRSWTYTNAGLGRTRIPAEALGITGRHTQGNTAPWAIDEVFGLLLIVTLRGVGADEIEKVVLLTSILLM